MPQSTFSQELGAESALLSLRLKLLERGYSPVAIDGKSPSPKIGWNNLPITPEILTADIAGYQRHTNTGLITTYMPTFDIDIWDDDHVGDIAVMVCDMIGTTPLLRRGRKGLAMPYRLDGNPIGKLLIREDTGERTEKGRPVLKTLVEILGKGNQIVAYGIHPDTGKPYQWLEDGKEPLCVPYDELPPVTPKQLREVAERVRQACAKLGYNVVGIEGGEAHRTAPPSTGSLDDVRDVTALFLALVPMGRVGARGWINFPCPACRHDDHKSGIRILGNGGFEYKCFHASCEYNKATGWQPPRHVLGPRERHLYELLGGNPENLTVQHRMGGYSCVDEMIADRERMRAGRAR